MIVALWLIRAIAGQIVGIVVYRSVGDEVIAEWTQVAMPGLVALARVLLLALVVVPLVFVAVHLHRRSSESPSRHLGGVSPAQALPAPQPTHRTAAGVPDLAGPVTPVPPFGAGVTGRGRPSPLPEPRCPPQGPPEAALGFPVEQEREHHHSESKPSRDARRRRRKRGAARAQRVPW